MWRLRWWWKGLLCPYGTAQPLTKRALTLVSPPPMPRHTTHLRTRTAHWGGSGSSPIIRRREEAPPPHPVRRRYECYAQIWQPESHTRPEIRKLPLDEVQTPGATKWTNFELPRRASRLACVAPPADAQLKLPPRKAIIDMLRPWRKRLHMTYENLNLK